MRITIKGAIALGSVLVATCLLQPYRPVVVRGESMEPTFRNGQVVFARRPVAAPQPGDIVVLAKDGGTIIKRVAMVAGDQYQLVKVPHAYMWTPIDDPVIQAQAKRYHWPVRTVTIPKGQLFVVGDNADVSLDSRDFGTVPVEAVRAVI